MSNALLTRSLPLAMSPADKVVLIVLADAARDPDAADRPSLTWLPIRGRAGTCGLVERTCLGERTVQRALRSLEAAGHISIEQIPGRGAKYKVHPLHNGTPATVAPRRSGTPATAAPTPAAAAPNPSETLNSQNTTYSSKRRREAAQIFAVPEWVPAEPWAGWLAMRKQQRKSPTARASELAVKKLKALADAGHPPAEVLDQSTFNQWTDLYPLKENRHEQRITHSRISPACDHPGGRTGAAADQMFGRMGSG